jgi:hypothetical protein
MRQVRSLRTTLTGQTIEFNAILTCPEIAGHFQGSTDPGKIIETANPL